MRGKGRERADTQAVELNKARIDELGRPSQPNVTLSPGEEMSQKLNAEYEARTELVKEWNWDEDDKQTFIATGKMPPTEKAVDMTQLQLENLIRLV